MAADGYATIGGGQSNNIYVGGASGVICGGGSNAISGSYSAILGGYGNTIPASCNYTSILGGQNITAAQSNTAYTQRLTTRGGRQKKITRLTASATLGLDDHYVIVYPYQSAMTVLLPATPIDGQEYHLKCTIGTYTCTISGNGKLIMTSTVGGSAPYATFTMQLYQAAWVLYSGYEDRWLMML